MKSNTPNHTNNKIKIETTNTSTTTTTTKEIQNSLNPAALALLPTIMGLAQSAGNTGLTGRVFLTRLGLEFNSGSFQQQGMVRRLSDLATSQLAVHLQSALSFLVKHKLLWISSSRITVSSAATANTGVPILNSSNIISFDDTFIANEYKQIVRFCCNRESDKSWKLIGGGYGNSTQDRAFVASMRNALTIAICEACFRQYFLGQAPGESQNNNNNEQQQQPVEEINHDNAIAVVVGIAVLPEIGPRHEGVEFLDWVCKYVSKKQYSTETALAKVLHVDENTIMRRVVSKLVLQQRLFRAISIDARSGKIKSWLTNIQPPIDEILTVRFAHPIHVDDFNQFNGSTLFHIRVGNTVAVIRKLDDIRWLRDSILNQVQLLQPQWLTKKESSSSWKLPALPLDRYLGRFNVDFMDLRLNQVIQFLERVVYDRQINHFKPVAAFFRSDFLSARAAVDVLNVCPSAKGTCPSNVIQHIIKLQKQQQIPIHPSPLTINNNKPTTIDDTLQQQLEILMNITNEFQRGETRASLGDAFLKLENFLLLETGEDMGIEPIALSCCEFEILHTQDYLCREEQHHRQQPYHDLNSSLPSSSNNNNNILFAFAEQQAARASREVARWKRTLDFWQV
jgi:hypothetical protein